VARGLERVTAAVREHAMFEPGRAVVAAVSGGADSLCLLHSLVRLRRLLRIHVVCFHFDHRLRAGSERDAAYVRGQARRLGVPFVLRRATTAPARGESVEAWARTARYRSLFEVAEEATAVAAAVGHTADDQAETVLMALLRGGGLEALGGMEPVSPPVVRPLLGVSRAETEAFCRALHLRPRQDPSNRDVRYLRNALRLRVIPELERLTRRDVKETIARSAQLLRADADELARQALEAQRDIVVSRDGQARIGVASLRSLPRPIALRVARHALMSVRLPPTEDAIETVLDLAAGRPGRRRDLAGGLIAARDKEYVRLSRSSPGDPSREKGGGRGERSGRNEGSRVARPRRPS
jgi:tRNA(Ile)-lysidine synthase